MHSTTSSTAGGRNGNRVSVSNIFLKLAVQHY
jgi:hypothetical protein